MPVRRIASIGLALVLLAALPASAGVSGLAVQDLNSVTAQDMAASLVGTGVTIEDVSYTGAPGAAGLFTGGTGILGFEAGVLLTTGSVDNAPGPNDTDSAQTTNLTPGDADVAALSGGLTYDASVLAIDFTADADEVTFRYVFGSEEYNEFVGNIYNDAFGFFVNGENCATVGDGDPVSVNTVNQTSHPELFRDNDDASIDVQYDGLTVVLTCTAPVSSEETNTLKLAIADAGDDVYDSGVFIEEGSLTTEPPEEPEGADLAVTKSDAPDPVISSGTVRYQVGVANAGPEASGAISLTDTPSAGRVISASGGGWSCAIGGNGASASCAHGPLAAGAAAAPLEVLVEAPSTQAASSITNTATVAHAGFDPNPANDTVGETTQVNPASSDEASTYCPPTGCTFGTTKNPTEDDNTGNRVVAPGSSGPFTAAAGSGSVTTLKEGVTTFPCGPHRKTGTDRFGQETDFLPPTGYTDPTNPIKVVTTYHDSTVDDRRVRVCMRKPRPSNPSETKTFRVKVCEVRGVAKPHPCLNKIRVMKNGNLRVVMLMLSPDPQWRR